MTGNVTIGPKTLVSAFVAMAMVLGASSAWPDTNRVVVLEPDARVLAAIDVALSPWGVGVVRAPGPLPDADIAVASAAARLLTGFI